MYNNCQVCGNPIFSADSHGTEADGRLNTEFCSNCYRNGQFYTQNGFGMKARGPSPADNALFSARLGANATDNAAGTNGASGAFGLFT